MVLKKALCVLLLSAVVLVPSAFAGKVELTTYYPAPYGEYSELNASKSFIPPRVNSTDRDLITATSKPPLAQGMVIFNTTDNRLEVNKDGTATGWVSAIGSSNDPLAAFKTWAGISNWPNIITGVGSPTAGYFVFSLGQVYGSQVDYYLGNSNFSCSYYKSTGAFLNSLGDGGSATCPAQLSLDGRLVQDY